MTKRTWSDLSPGQQRLVLAVGGVEGLLKLAALVDLARRPAAGVRGPKRRWATAIVLTNSAGIAPLVYFRRGRRKA